MKNHITGLHHLTAIATDAQANIDFYAGLLGLRLVKKTVNFDNPSAYHLYYGDGTGTPGSIITFFSARSIIANAAGFSSKSPPTLRASRSTKPRNPWASHSSSPSNSNPPARRSKACSRRCRARGSSPDRRGTIGGARPGLGRGPAGYPVDLAVISLQLSVPGTNNRCQNRTSILFPAERSTIKDPKNPLPCE